MKLIIVDFFENKDKERYTLSQICRRTNSAEKKDEIDDMFRSPYLGLN